MTKKALKHPDLIFLGACIIGEPWFTGSRDLGELCILGEPYLGEPYLGEPKLGEPFFLFF